MTMLSFDDSLIVVMSIFPEYRERAISAVVGKCLGRKMLGGT